MDVLIAGAGVIGCSAAALLAEAGHSVTVLDRTGIAAGASGRNSGVLQYPFDEVLGPLHWRTVELQREVLPDLAETPDGTLLLGTRETAGHAPVLRAEVVEEARDVEPLVRAGIPGVLLHMGYVVGPERVTHAWAERARAAGVAFETGEWRRDDPARADVTLIATGAWAPGVAPLWGVTAPIAQRAGVIIEEAGVDDVVNGEGGVVFSVCGQVLGSSAGRTEPDPQQVLPTLVEHSARFVDGGVTLAGPPRVCPRPNSRDGRPLVGRLDERTWMCAGHGAWGISIGPATSELLVRALLDGAPIPAELDPLRFDDVAAQFSATSA